MKKDIAIIGMAGRFPGASNIDILLNHLKSGRQNKGKISRERIKSAKLKQGGEYFSGAFINRIDAFDYKFFGISKGEANLMCPSQRMILEIIYKTIDNAGYSLEKLSGTKTSIFGLQGNNDYIKLAKKRTPLLKTGGMNPFLLTKITKFFNWRGASIMVNTACSSGLTALHLACNEIKNGDSNYALVCGANIYVLPEKNREEFNYDVLSETGITSAFSEEASGISRGEAAVVILLKSLKKAKEDKDIIHAVIKSTAINNNASYSSSPTEPDARAQAEVIREAWEKAVVSPRDIGYIEAHGSGTKLGDSIEVLGLNIYLRSFLNKNEIIPISTIKSNIGHSMSCAGLCGVIKAVLSVKYNYIFPMAGFKKPSSVINFKNSNVAVTQKLRRWESRNRPRIVGITSIGISGVNGHLVLAEKPKEKTRVNELGNSCLITYSANSSFSLNKGLIKFYKYLKGDNLNLNNISYTLNCCRTHFNYRFAVVVNSLEALMAAIEEKVKTEKEDGVFENYNQNVIIVFSEYKNIPIALINYLSDYSQIFRDSFGHLKNLEKNGYWLNLAYQYSIHKIFQLLGVSSMNFLGLGAGDILCDVAGGKLSIEQALHTATPKSKRRESKLYSRLSRLVKEETKKGNTMFLVMGHENSFVEKLKYICIDNEKAKTLTLANKGGANEPILDLIKKLYLSGLNINWEKYGEVYSGNKIELPAYQFEQTSCWLEQSDIKHEYRIRENIKPLSVDFNNQKLKDDISLKSIREEVLKTWAKVLKCDIGTVNNSFFDLGGDSLLATKIIKDINDKFDINLDFEDLYDYQTISQLSALIGRKLNVVKVLIGLWQEVLKSKDIRENDNFFNLGGHSLLATQIINRINNYYNVEINFNDIYNNPTPRELAEKIIQKKVILTPLIKSTIKKEYYRLSWAQKRIWFHYQMKPNNPFYNTNFVYDIIGNINISLLEKSFTALINRHESFRTNFIDVNGEPVQIINKKRALKIKIIDLCDIKERRKQKNKEEEIIKKLIQTPIKLESESLIKVIFFKKQSIKANLINLSGTLLVIIHHIIFDGWSFTVFFRELEKCYRAHSINSKPDLPELLIKYKDYAEWELSKDSEKQLMVQEKYWLEVLKAPIKIIDIPHDKPRLRAEIFSGGLEQLVISSRLTKQIKKLIKTNDCTMFVFLYSIFNIFIYRITGQKDIIVGTAFNNRGLSELEGIVGMFANNLPLRIKLSNDYSFFDLLTKVKRVVVGAASNERYLFERLISRLKIGRSDDGSSMFNIMFIVDPLSARDNDLQLSNIKAKFRFTHNQTTLFDIYLRAIEYSDHIIFRLEYNVDIFYPKTIKLYLQYYLNLIKEVLARPEIKINELDIITEEEKRKLIYQKNKTQVQYPKQKTIHQLFEEQVRKTPDNIALKYKNNKITYGELNQKANQIAHHLQERYKVKSDTPITLLAERSIGAIISILAILKSGGYYIPIDLGYPKERIKYMLIQSRSGLVLSDAPREMVAKIFKAENRRPQIINICDTNVFSNYAVTNPKNRAGKNSLAYVIYTSGSTGNPKGVMITQQSVLNTMNWLQGKFRLTKKDTVAQKTSLSFTDSVWEIFWPFIVGSKLSIIDDDTVKDPTKLLDMFNQEKITYSQFVPAIMVAFLETARHQEKAELPYLKWIFNGGEHLPPPLANRWHRKFPNVRIANIYGMTESAIYATCHIVGEKEDEANISVPIGRPIANTKVLILDKNKNLCPINIPGEIYIGGRGIAKGYLHKPKLTKESFIYHPETKETLYKTGDLGKITPDGIIEYLGRVDYQVNIRGFRIELGEIEAQLRKCPKMGQVVVVARPDKQKFNILIAYYTAINRMEPKVVRNFLRQKLPDYMIPICFVYLKTIPLNPNGKIDRKALPEPKEKDFPKNKYEVPMSTTEEKLAQIWREVLGVDKISRHDNFFDLGGYSLTAIQAHNKINKLYPGKISIVEIFTYSTIVDLSARIHSDNITTKDKEDKDLKNSIMEIINQIDKSNIAEDKLIEQLKKL